MPQGLHVTKDASSKVPSTEGISLDRAIHLAMLAILACLQKAADVGGPNEVTATGKQMVQRIMAELVRVAGPKDAESVMVETYAILSKLPELFT